MLTAKQLPITGMRRWEGIELRIIYEREHHDLLQPSDLAGAGLPPVWRKRSSPSPEPAWKNKFSRSSK